jgi:tricorn protease-like protein
VSWVTSTNGNLYQASALVNRAGSRVMYTKVKRITSAIDGSTSSIFAIAPGGGLADEVCDDCGQLRSWSADGSVILSQQDMFEASKYIGTRILRTEVREKRTTVLLEKRGTLLFSPDLSPNGRWVAFQSPVNKQPFEHIFIAPADTRSRVEPDRWTAVTDQKYFDANPEWSRNGKMLFFISDRDGFSCLWAVKIDAISKKPQGEPFTVKHFHGNPQHYLNFPTYSVGPDRIVMSLDDVRSDLWMLPDAS